jgi:hypothetical protein
MFEKGYAWERERYMDKDVFVDLPGASFDIAKWTSVTKDNRLLNHVLSLFWTWDNSVERLLCKPMFDEDLMSLDPTLWSDPSRLSFCTPFLVNALLALGCVSYYVSSETNDSDTQCIALLSRGRNLFGST